MDLVCKLRRNLFARLMSLFKLLMRFWRSFCFCLASRRRFDEISLSCFLSGTGLCNTSILFIDLANLLCLSIKDRGGGTVSCLELSEIK